MWPCRFSWIGLARVLTSLIDIPPSSRLGADAPRLATLPPASGAQSDSLIRSSHHACEGRCRKASERKRASRDGGETATGSCDFPFSERGGDRPPRQGDLEVVAAAALRVGELRVGRFDGGGAGGERRFELRRAPRLQRHRAQRDVIAGPRQAE